MDRSIIIVIEKLSDKILIKNSYLKLKMVRFWKSKLFIVVAGTLVVLVVVIGGLLWWNFKAQRVGEPVQAVITMAKNLEIPWALDFLPDGSIILTERPGRIRFIDAEKGLLSNPLLTIDEVAHRGEGGLLGIAAHPDFNRNGFIYVYYTYENNGGLSNKVVRYRMQDSELIEATDIIADIPGASVHNGGRLKFGPDNLLYVTAGDASNPQLAQDARSLAGKILRLNHDGSLPQDNPFPDSPVYSYGHRNPQGLAWDSAGRLWATEHGSTGTDELNLIEPGVNYGWPVIRGDESAPGLQSPVIHSGPDTWAPSGLSFSNGSLWFCGLRSQSLFEARMKDGSMTLHRHLEKQFGRLRDAVISPDGNLYITTSNQDGRGLASADDDQILKIDISLLESR
jgi:glucose/arabinose dehydrogenase